MLDQDQIDDFDLETSARFHVHQDAELNITLIEGVAPVTLVTNQCQHKFSSILVTEK